MTVAGWLLAAVGTAVWLAQRSKKPAARSDKEKELDKWTRDLRKEAWLRRVRNKRRRLTQNGK